MRFFSIKQASMGTKLGLAFACMILIVVATGGMGLLSVRKINGEVDLFAKATVVPMFNISAELSDRLYQFQLGIFETRQLGSAQAIDEKMKKLGDILSDYDAHVSKLTEMVQKERLAVDLEKIKTGKDRMKMLLEKCVASSQKKISVGNSMRDKLAEFELTERALDQQLADFTSQSETAMNAKEDSSRTLEQSGNATAASMGKVIADLFAEDFPLVKASTTLQRYLMKMQELTHAFLNETEEAKLLAIVTEFEKIAGKVSGRLSRFSGRGNQAAVDGVKTGFSNLQEKVTGPDGLFAQRRTILQELLQQDELDREVQALLREIATSLADLKKTAGQINNDTTEKISGGAVTSQNQVALLILAGVALGIAIAFIITRAIAPPIQRVVKDLDQDSDRVAQTAIRVAESSHLVSKDASEQATSIEEVSSSLEEMAAMTRQNADNARQGSMIMQAVSQVVQRATASMMELTASMSSISKASEETSKIVKTIEEIAFQTNLLALNAAVEAARAGEAGAGFAVVADEVRNLAMRASGAAKNTALLIEDTVGKVKGGGGMVSRVSEDFSAIMESTTKLGALINEITAASDDQAKGVEQISTAISEMGRMVQATAANVEESAALAEDLKASAVEMKTVVGTLETLVQGGGQNGSSPEEEGRRLLAMAPSAR